MYCHCWARYLLWAVIAVFGVGSMLSACGQKGDLYLAEPKSGGVYSPGTHQERVEELEESKEE